LVALITTVSRTSPAAILTAVPMQGGMVMPMISYHAASGTVGVMLDPTIPQLTPLRISHSTDSFDPGDPWFDALDPSRQGLAFSRRYGFVMDTMTDALPPGTALWIRKISGSPDLGFFRYRNTAPKAWEPIFGTAGSPDAWRWDGMMFHPGITAPPADTDLSATFEVYLADASTGAPIAGSGTGPFQLAFTRVPDGRPTLAIAQKLVLRWPTTQGRWILEASDNPTGSPWTPVGIEPVTLDGQPTVLLEASGTRKFYRLAPAP
jgi:hypothetical protein